MDQAGQQQVARNVQLWGEPHTESTEGPGQQWARVSPALGTRTQYPVPATRAHADPGRERENDGLWAGPSLLIPLTCMAQMQSPGSAGPHTKLLTQFSHCQHLSWASSSSLATLATAPKWACPGTEIKKLTEASFADRVAHCTGRPVASIALHSLKACAYVNRLLTSLSHSRDASLFLFLLRQSQTGEIHKRPSSMSFRNALLEDKRIQLHSPPQKIDTSFFLLPVTSLRKALKRIGNPWNAFKNDRIPLERP